MKVLKNYPQQEVDYDFTDVFGRRHYHSSYRHYIVGADGRGYPVITSYTNSEYEDLYR